MALLKTSAVMSLILLLQLPNTVSWARSLIRFLMRLGIFAPLLVEVLDTSFFYLPLANELVLTALISSRSGPPWFVYPLMAATGSVVGVLMLDILARKMGEEGLERFAPPHKVKELKLKLKKRAAWAIFAASVLPPPFPFRVVMITASALQIPRLSMLSGVFAGRLARYTCESILIVNFGGQLLTLMESPVLDYVIYGLSVVMVVGSFFTIRVWIWKSNKDRRALKGKQTTD